jgi:hypothetical protein
MRQSNLDRWSSQTPGNDDRVPEEHSEKSNHNNAKDETPRFENRGSVLAGGQAVGIAHAKLLGRPRCQVACGFGRRLRSCAAIIGPK